MNLKSVVAFLLLSGCPAAFSTPQAEFSSKQAQPQSEAGVSSATLSGDPMLAIRTVDLWPNGAPGALGKTSADTPALDVFAPRPEDRNGTGVIIAPGGAYLELSADKEGRDPAAWFSARGVTAFVLRYRLGAKYVYPIPLDDSMRAMRVVRAHAAAYGLDPERIGMMGFSAGGHLAAMTGVLGGGGDPAAPDPVDRVSSRPDFLILAYPWLNAMLPNTTGRITYCSVLPSIPKNRCVSFERPYTPLYHVNRMTPPTFLYITSDDNIVSVSAAVAFHSALLEAGVPDEFHSFAHGPHGSGLGNGDPALDLWPVLLEGWLRGKGLLTRPMAP